MSETPLTDSLRVGIALYDDPAQRLADALEHAKTLESALSASRERAEQKQAGLMRLTAALSKIDYACGEPNEMQCSGYDVHCDEEAVVKRVKALRERAERLVSAADEMLAVLGYHGTISATDDRVAAFCAALEKVRAGGGE